MSQLLFILADTEFKCSEISNILNIAKFVLRAIQFIVPILLILWGTIDLVKSVVAGKEDDIKKNQKTLIKRVISAVIVFLIPVAVYALLNLLGASNNKDGAKGTGSDNWYSCWKHADAKIPSISEY